jgi:1-acyl-sn-glycerol-3-phosphate acyltransferase
MHSALLPALAALLLFLPWAIAPRSPRKPEIHGFLVPLWWVNAFYCALMHRLVCEKQAPLPAHGPAILISNHTCGIDHMILQAGSQRVLGFMIALEFYNHWLCNLFCRLLHCIPVKRDGRDLAATRAALRALEEGRVVPIFPEGRIRATSGREFGAPKPGAAFIALRARVPVVPAYIQGTPTTGDVFKDLYTASHARVVFGPPIDLTDFESSNGQPTRQALDIVSERFMNAIKALRDQSLAAER